jgi:hypothetical protein
MPTDDLLAKCARRLEDDADFFASQLRRRPAGEWCTLLGCEEGVLARLALCRRPREGRCRADLLAVSDYLGVDVRLVATVEFWVPPPTGGKARRTANREP